MDLSFLYSTRTILRSGKVSSRLPTGLSRPKTRLRCLHQPAQDDARDQTSFFREKAEAVAAKLGPRERSTITREEQRAFQNLRRLADQIQRPGHRSDISSDTNLLNADPQKILAHFTPTSAAPGDSDAQIHRICEEYMTAVSNEFKDALQSDPSGGDLAIWKVLRRRVFPLLTLLKDQERVSQGERHAAEIALPVAKSLLKVKEHGSEASMKSSSAGSDLATKDETITSTATAPTSPSPSANRSISPLPILTRIYPASLLLALRLLTRHYPLSTLTPSLLPYVRSLGSSSYVLGTNTHFYNTLLLLRWNTHSSLRELCSLLTEMERGAVEFDRGTYRVLRDVADERWSDLTQHDSSPYAAIEDLAEGKLVSRGAQWWSRQEQAQWWPKVETWRNMIAKKLEEKGMGEVLREGPPTASPPGWDAGQSQSASGVWL